MVLGQFLCFAVRDPFTCQKIYLLGQVVLLQFYHIYYIVQAQHCPAPAATLGRRLQSGPGS